MSTGLLSGFNALSFASQVQAWWEPIILLSELSGFAMLVFALVRLARMGARQDHGGFSGVIMAALVGVLLLSLSETVGTFSSTLFGASATNPLAYAAPPNTSGLSSIEIMGLTIVRVIGLVGFVRGLWYLKESGTKPDLLGHAFTRLIGGLLAMHLMLVLSILSSSGL